MRTSPRGRRLAADYQVLVQLQNESSIFSFDHSGALPESYEFYFRGVGLWEMDDGRVVPRDFHHLHLELGSAYPRMMPVINWRTPIFHPNISTNGVVCLGGYSTYWVPSLKLDELCVMLWDMIRYQNFDIGSPYNREAALWARDQATMEFPLDRRPLRDRVSGDAPSVIDATVIRSSSPPPVIPHAGRGGASAAARDRAKRSAAEIVFID